MHNQTNEQEFWITRLTPMEVIAGLTRNTVVYLEQSATPAQVGAIPHVKAIMITRDTASTNAIKKLNRHSMVVLDINSTQEQAAAIPNGVVIAVKDSTPMTAISGLKIGAIVVLYTGITADQVAALPKRVQAIIERNTPTDAIAALQPHTAEILLLNATVEQISYIPYNLMIIITSATLHNTIAALPQNALISLGNKVTPEQVDALPELTQIRINGSTPLEAINALNARASHLKKVVLGSKTIGAQIKSLPAFIEEIEGNAKIPADVIAAIRGETENYNFIGQYCLKKKAQSSDSSVNGSKRLRLFSTIDAAQTTTSVSGQEIEIGIELLNELRHTEVEKESMTREILGYGTTS